MILRPCSIVDAIGFVAQVHRRHPRVVGGMWAIRALVDGQTVGVVIVGRPVASVYQERGFLEVTRLAAVPGNNCVCSALYGAAARAARAMGAPALLTYTETNEPGTSLVAAGWICDQKRRNGRSWVSAQRPRAEQRELIDRWCWWAPWSEIKTGDAR
jgi:hypothetical protein